MKFEFGDLNRFLVSSGIVLVSLAIIVPWLFLKEPMGVVFNEKDFVALEKTSRLLVSSRQDQVIRITRILPYLSSGLFAVGLVLSTIGLWRWSRIQKIHDAKERIALAVDENHLRKMTEADVKEKLDKEAEEVQSVDSKPLATQNFHTVYQLTEAMIASRLVQITSSTYTVLQEYRVGRTFIDILLRANTLSSPDYVLEIKYRRGGLVASDLERSYFQSINAAETVEKASNRKVRSKLIIVLGPESSSVEKTSRKRDLLYQKFPQKVADHQIIIMSDSELRGLSDGDFITRLAL